AGREIIGSIGVVAVAVIARDIGRSGGNRDRAAEARGLPAAACLVREREAGELRAGAAPERADMRTGVVDALVIFEARDEAARRRREFHAERDGTGIGIGRDRRRVRWREQTERRARRRDRQSDTGGAGAASAS